MLSQKFLAQCNCGYCSSFDSILLCIFNKTAFRKKDISNFFYLQNTSYVGFILKLPMDRVMGYVILADSSPTL